LIHIAHLWPDSKWRIKPHSHPFHELIIILKGKMTVRIHGQEEQVQAGDVLVYLAGNIHEEISDKEDPVESLFLAFSHELAEETPWRSQDREGRVRQLGAWIYADQSASSEEGAEARQALLTALFAELARLQKHPKQDAAVLGVTRKYIQRHLTKKITLDALARAAGLSKFHYSRVYRDLANCTPMETVREMRLNYACQLLLTTHLPLKQVAPMAGLGDEYQLSHLFRKYHGMPPGQLRRGSTSAK
jgi:AraC-like DNA-binding protein/mannose-6-phosphate isomerase-like protein (cupin superfamily)